MYKRQHHGLLEYGSPVRPRIMEAEILHMIDNLDAEMMMMTGALAKVGEGETVSYTHLEDLLSGSRSSILFMRCI